MAEQMNEGIDMLVAMYRAKGQTEITTQLFKDVEGYGYQHFGLLVVDLVRHVAAAFDVAEDDVWEWVDKERRHPTSPITQHS